MESCAGGSGSARIVIMAGEPFVATELSSEVRSCGQGPLEHVGVAVGVSGEDSYDCDLAYE